MAARARLDDAPCRPGRRCASKRRSADIDLAVHRAAAANCRRGRPPPWRRRPRRGAARRTPASPMMANAVRMPCAASRDHRSAAGSARRSCAPLRGIAVRAAARRPAAHLPDRLRAGSAAAGSISCGLFAGLIGQQAREFGALVPPGGYQTTFCSGDGRDPRSLSGPATGLAQTLLARRAGRRS